MPVAPTLPLSIVCNVTVNIQPPAAATPGFNQAIIIGTSPVIPSTERLRLYTGSLQMTSDGFGPTMPEFLAAEMYWGQQPPPFYLWVGRQDLTAIATLSPGTTAGTGYKVGDIVTVVQASASNGTAKVTTIGAGGSITALQMVTGGTGYSVANGLLLTGGSGAGAQVNILTIGETPLQALQACRAASSNWWACYSTTATVTDITAIAGWIQSVTPSSFYFFTTQDANVLTGTGIFSTLKLANYTRVLGLYSTTQGTVAPNNIYAGAAAMGVAMGLNTSLANSYFTMQFKPLIGIIPEPLTFSQIQTIEGNNGNLYLSYGNTDEWMEHGTTPSGEFFDQVLGLDMLASDIQYSVVNLLTGTPVVPQTDPGESQIISAVNDACGRSATRGFVSKGVWKGQTILSLTAGTSLPLGYMTLAQPFALQSAIDHSARKAMPIYVCVILTNAVHSIVIGVYVQM